jgi:hypothetical protein
MESFMFAQSRARSPANTGRRSAIQLGFPTLRVALLLVASLMGGCSAVPPAPLAGPNPADPGTRAPSAAYLTVVGPYASQRPRDPSGWREQNERIAPEAKP